MAIIFVALGLLLVGIDIYVPTQTTYPTYVRSADLGDNIQDYISNNILTNHFRIDIFSDIIGCILIMIGITMLLKYSKRYIVSYVFLLTTGALSIGLTLIPFWYNGEKRIVTTLVVYFFLLVSELFMEYLVVYTTVGISDSLPNQSYNKRMQFGWLISVIARVFMFFLQFVGLVYVYRGYQVIAICSITFYVWQLIRMRKYAGTSKYVKMSIKERLLRDKSEE